MQQNEPYHVTTVVNWLWPSAYLCVGLRCPESTTITSQPYRHPATINIGTTTSVSCTPNPIRTKGRARSSKRNLPTRVRYSSAGVPRVKPVSGLVYTAPTTCTFFLLLAFIREGSTPNFRTYPHTMSTIRPMHNAPHPYKRGTPQSACQISQRAT